MSFVDREYCLWKRLKGFRSTPVEHTQGQARSMAKVYPQGKCRKGLKQLVQYATSSCIGIVVVLTNEIYTIFSILAFLGT